MIIFMIDDHTLIETSRLSTTEAIRYKKHENDGSQQNIQRFLCFTLEAKQLQKLSKTLND